MVGLERVRIGGDAKDTSRWPGGESCNFSFNRLYFYDEAHNKCADSFILLVYFPLIKKKKIPSTRLVQLQECNGL